MLAVAQSWEWTAEFRLGTQIGTQRFQLTVLPLVILILPAGAGPTMLLAVRVSGLSQHQSESTTQWDARTLLEFFLARGVSPST
jgi:hypothetical protein